MILMASVFLMEKCNRVKCALTQYSMLKKKKVGYSENTGMTSHLKELPS